MIAQKECGCKGIRSCLLCEKDGTISYDLRTTEKVKCIYIYCPHCNLCWPEDENNRECKVCPLFLGKLNLFLEFLTQDEESELISAIDKIQWVSSQSGRKKQDFGPKVNFKKRKVKLGEFRGFPGFTESVLQRFKILPVLSDFNPVELCHLEYSPERGSSIDPHIDDVWLWGERLVTINLGSSTVLTLVPASTNICDCHEGMCYDSLQSLAHKDEYKNEAFMCNHKISDMLHLDNHLESLSVTHALKKNKDLPEKSAHVITNEDFYDSKSSAAVVTNRDGSILCSNVLSCSNEKTIQSLSQDEPQCHSTDNIRPKNNSKLFSEILKLDSNDYINKTGLQTTNHRNRISDNETEKSKVLNATTTSSNKNTRNVIKSICDIFRSDISETRPAVRIVLPPRSLLVLSGCARYNWFHEIKRQDIQSRRLAMTFRELTAEFLEGGKQSEIGIELLSVANNFSDF